MKAIRTIFEVLNTDTEVAPLLGPFQTAFENKAMEQLEGMIGTLRVLPLVWLRKNPIGYSAKAMTFDLKVSVTQRIHATFS